MRNINIDNKKAIENDMILISKIYESFEALEETLGKLKLEEPLFITYAAKKSFANTIYKQVKRNIESPSRMKN